MYLREILEACLRINGLLDMIKLSRLFLEEREGVGDDSSFKINNGEFIRYHSEAFYMRISSFKDLILKLINRTYNFGFKENLGLEKRIRNISKQHEEIRKHLEGLDIIIDSVKSVRNDIAHGGFHTDPLLVLVEASNLTKKTEESKKEYSMTLKELLINCMSTIYAYELMVSGYSRVIFDQLLPVRKRIEKGL